MVMEIGWTDVGSGGYILVSILVMIDIEMKLNIPVHYQMGNPLQQGR
jgi:hypothetical protein